MSDTQAAANILVVDDTPANVRLLTGLLDQLGCNVRPATSGVEALMDAERHPPDLVLLDVTMPEMDGYEVCRRFKASLALKDVPVIFLTALTDVASKVKAFEVGGIDYVTKPFHHEEVLARVQTHLALRSANVALARSYSRLQQLEQLREDLVNMVVHDMRSPLTVLSGHLTLLKEECTNLGPHAAEDLDAALEGARAIAGLANDLLDVSRLEEGKLPLDVAEHDLGLLAETVRASLRAFQRGRAIELDAQTPAVIACDAGIVRRILENLVSNAIKHTPTGSPVRISVLAHGDRARVAVSDLGPGIPVEARERIFEKFGVVSARRQDRYHSAGLGLAFCKLAVQAHGGRIGVDAGEPSGSTFWFELPRAARTAAPAG